LAYRCLRPSGKGARLMLYIIVGVIAALLLAYLFFALLKPELF
jgi:K+-transporting ATPase KdpF subunit